MKMFRTVHALLCSVSLIGGLWNSAEAQASCSEERGKTHNKFEIGRLQFSPRYMFECGVLSLSGEVGHRNYRIDASLARWLTECQRIKIGGEYLTQDLHWKFSSGKLHRWTNQYALGGTYQYMVGNWFIKSIDVHAQYSKTADHHLNNVTCSATSTLKRFLAGSTSYDIEIGATVKPWWCANLNLMGLYENVRVHRKWHSNKTIAGWGFRGRFEQNIWMGISVVLKGEWKKAYNYREALLNCAANTDWGYLTVGVFAGQVKGRKGFNDSTLYGVQLGLAFGCCDSNGCCRTDVCSQSTICNEEALCNQERREVPIAPELEKNEHAQEGKGSSDDYNAKSSNVCSKACVYDHPHSCCYDELLIWAMEPAVYLPEMYCLPEQKFDTVALPPPT